MKRDRFWKKLLSLGLAAAMTVASLTGPGSATNPVEVKAAEKTSLAGARVALAGVDNVTEDGKTEYGCRFLELTEEDQERITQNIFAAQRQKMGRG